MSERDEVLRFLLPDLLGKPSGITDKNGHLVFTADFEIPPDNYVFFISVEEWLGWKNKKAQDDKGTG